jgi:hypothetical protein
MSNLSLASTKTKITSFILGTFGALWIVSCVVSFKSLAVHEVIFRIGAAFTFFAFALEPSILFQPLPRSIKDVGISNHHSIQLLLEFLSKSG